MDGDEDRIHCRDSRFHALGRSGQDLPFQAIVKWINVAYWRSSGRRTCRWLAKETETDAVIWLLKKGNKGRFKIVNQ